MDIKRETDKLDMFAYPIKEGDKVEIHISITDNAEEHEEGIVVREGNNYFVQIGDTKVNLKDIESNEIEII